MDPVKLAIYKTINSKCVSCKDFTFCKLPYYYHQKEECSIQDLQNLKNCIFYKREKEEKAQIILSQSWI